MCKQYYLSIHSVLCGHNVVPSIQNILLTFILSMSSQHFPSIHNRKCIDNILFLVFFCLKCTRYYTIIIFLAFCSRCTNHSPLHSFWFMYIRQPSVYSFFSAQQSPYNSFCLFCIQRSPFHSFILFILYTEQSLFIHSFKSVYNSVPSIHSV